MILENLTKHPKDLFFRRNQNVNSHWHENNWWEVVLCI